jgi:Flp pilus assembly protein TadG
MRSHRAGRTCIGQARDPASTLERCSATELMTAWMDIDRPTYPAAPGAPRSRRVAVRIARATQPGVHEPHRLTQLASRLRACRGQTMVEFALILSVLMLVVFGCVRVGMAYFTYEEVASAANAGARAAAVNRAGDPAGAALTAARAISPTLGLSASQVSVTYASTASPAGASWSYPGTATVTVTYPVAFDILGQFSTVFNLQATTTKRLER